MRWAAGRAHQPSFRDSAQVYEKLTERAQEVFRCARQEAQRLGHHYVGTEHLLLAISRIPSCSAAAALMRLGVDLDDLRNHVEARVKGGTDVISAGREYKLTPRAREALDRASKECGRLGRDHVGTEHLLVALMAQTDCVAADVLHSMRLRPDRVREACNVVVGLTPPEQNSRPMASPDREVTAIAGNWGAEARNGPEAAEEPVPAAEGLYELAVEASFSAAHNLREYPGNCERLHGHNWRVRVCVASSTLDDLGMVVDFRDLKGWISEVIDRLDHTYINEVEPFDSLNPTTENLCRHIAGELQRQLPRHVLVRRVTCWESDRCSATYVPRPASG